MNNTSENNYDKMEPLKLENQLCFPIYAASRLITKQYKPILDEIGLTYPQYLVMLVLWEQDSQPVNDIAKKLYLNTNTITPLIKRMEKLDYVSRERSSEDERKIIVSTTALGKDLHISAKSIPDRISDHLCDENLNMDDLIRLKNTLNNLIATLSAK